MPDQRGLHNKYEVRRTDGRDQPGGDREGSFLFVLDATHDIFARQAIRAYAEACAQRSPQLAADLLAELTRVVTETGLFLPPPMMMEERGWLGTTDD